MTDKKFIFIGGLHRSGTTLIHKILRSHPGISGFHNTGVPMDEGQLLQTVYPAAKVFGGPGRFAFNPASFMDEGHPLATPENASKLFQEWSRHWDLTKEYLLEKSPPNLVRTRFLQKLFPQSIFVMIFRHPIAVAYATHKWAPDPTPSLIEHGLRCYERFQQDIRFLRRVYVLRYEDFVREPDLHMQTLLDWIGIERFTFDDAVLPDINSKYFAVWKAERPILSQAEFKDASAPFGTFRDFETRANAFGYSINEPDTLLPCSLFGPHDPTNIL